MSMPPRGFIRVRIDVLRNGMGKEGKGFAARSAQPQLGASTKQIEIKTGSESNF